MFIRQKSKVINKEPIQLDLFIPHEYGYEFKVIVTNKKTTAKKVPMYHNGRASQESIFGELKLPYQDTVNYVVSCTDCHEPQGPLIILSGKRQIMEQ